MGIKSDYLPQNALFVYYNEISLKFSFLQLCLTSSLKIWSVCSEDSIVYDSLISNLSFFFANYNKDINFLYVQFPLCSIRCFNNYRRHSHFLFIRSCNFNWIACVTSFFALSGASFFLLIRVIFGHTWLTSLSKTTSSLWNWLWFTLMQRDKVKWVCVTRNEGYLRSANRGSNNLYRFLIKI